MAEAAGACYNQNRSVPSFPDTGLLLGFFGIAERRNISPLRACMEYADAKILHQFPKRRRDCAGSRGYRITKPGGRKRTGNELCPRAVSRQRQNRLKELA